MTRLTRVAVVAVGLIIAYAFATTCVSLERHIRDSHATYRGTVVAKGKVRSWLWPRSFPDHYIVIRDSGGVERRRYVSTEEYLMAQPGTWVEKPPGFSSLVRRPGQLSSNEMLDTLEALQSERDPVRRDSLLAHLRR